MVVAVHAITASESILFLTGTMTETFVLMINTFPCCCNCTCKVLFLSGAYVSTIYTSALR